MTKTIICLANSRKISGRCIAGKIQYTNTWIRPISDRPTEEISEEERRYKNGTTPDVLDIITVSFKSHKPKNFQSENWLIDDGVYWVKEGVYPFASLDTICDNPASLWNNHSSSYNGKNDRISNSDTTTLSNSLFFVKILNSKIIVRVEGAEFNNAKRKVRIRFQYGGIDYILPITDPKIESEYFQKVDGEYSINTSHYLCISLGLPHTDGYCYIFAAAVFK